MGMLEGGSRLKLLLGLIWLLSLCNGAWAVESCRAVFSGGLQTHGSIGSVKFQWGAQLLANPSASIDTARVQANPWSAATCGSSNCKASGQVTASLGPLVLPSLTTEHDLRLTYMASGEAGGDALNSYRHIDVDAGADLSFSTRHQAYYIQRLSIGYGARVTLAPGRYWIGRLDIASSGQLQVSGGSARVMVGSGFELPFQARLNAAENGAGNPDKLQLIVNGGINQGSASLVNAVAYVEGDYRSEFAARWRGALSARSIDIGTLAKVETVPAAIGALSWNNQCEERNDLDGDGTLDLFDSDTDGDGIDDENERLAGSDPRDAQSIPATPAPSGYTSLCVAAFTRGLQTFGEEGRIDFGYNAQLRGGTSFYLPAMRVNSHFGSSLRSCDAQHCQPSFDTIEVPTLPAYRKTTSSFAQTVRAKRSLELDGSRQEWHRLSLAAGARVRFSQPGEYRLSKVSLAHRAVLELAPGDYWIESLDLGSEARLQPIGNGTVRLHLLNNLQSPWQALLNADGYEQPGNPSKLLIFARGNVTLGASTTTAAYVYARGKLNQEYASLLYGGAVAKGIRLDTMARTHQNLIDLPATDFAALCDLDDDGIGDNLDADRDGDGIANDYEEQVGTDPDDAASVPADQDSDGIPDSLDDDRDGDGAVNDEDAFPDDASESKDLDGDGIGDNADPDRDGDGISNDYETQLGTDPDDNTSTPADQDGDAIPDSLDDDRDGDGVANEQDVFPDDASESKDLDGDGIGDNADPDRDGDGISNDYEEQVGTDPNAAGSVPADQDGDGIPDVLDLDRDGDGVPNDLDAFPDDSTEFRDQDGDGIGDNADLDRDGDGISNDYETQVGTDPNDAGSTPPDQDGDAIPDSLDDDRDGDGVPNDQDAFPDDASESKDLDGDGIGDNADPDRDGDGISNDYETQVGTDPDDKTSTPPDQDGDAIPDSLDDDRDGDGIANEQDVFPDDASESKDLDGDGIGDNADPDRDGDGISNDYEEQLGTDPNDSASTPTDQDKDGIPDSLDDDRDGDGVANDQDVFPDDASESKDLDGDGIGDNADPDRDGDGISNDYETQLGTDPDDNTNTPADQDGDGIPDSLDDDRDGDNIANDQDVFPDDASESKDLDGDGIGDNADPDRDGDGISNDYEGQVGTDPDDNTSTPPDQDGDGIPNSVDDDRDGDGVFNPDDAFPDDPSESKDLDGDGIGDNADPDRDGDGISNDYEVQLGTDPNDPHSTPADQDKDGIPDSLDDDRDGDGVANDQDALPDDATESKDLDGDGIGDNADPDRDGDGISNDYEEQVGTNPNDAGSVPADQDKDGIPDSLDDDRDGDGVANDQDVFPDDASESKDLDGDGIGDNADPDRDGDGISNDYEEQVGTDPNDSASTPADQDKDGIPDSLDDDRDGDGVANDQDVFPDDASESRDMDGDGVGDNADPDRDGDGISNEYETQAGTDPNDSASTPLDQDKDGIPDSLDDDRDGDGVPNDQDAFPDDAGESKDLDGDGVGDNADPDRDGDGISNEHEEQLGTNPDNAGSKPADQDGDGLPDSLDDDRDGDGVANDQDAFPDDASESKDLDGDGIGDNADTDRDGDGASNADEVAAGTDPDDASDFPDRVAPEVGIDGPDFLSVNEDSLNLSGSVSDSGSGVDRLEFASDRFPGARFAVSVQAAQWTASVPLLEGSNLLTLTAFDKAGNAAQLTRNVERQPLASDIGLRIDYPQSGAVLTDATLVVRGLLRSDQPAQRLEVLVNGQAATLSPTAQVTEFSFQSAALELQPGPNTLSIQGWVEQRSVQRSVLVTYQPPQTSFAAPRFDNLSPANGSLLPGASFVLSGQVFAEGGLQRVTLDGRSLTLREPGAQLLDLRESLTIPDGQSTFGAELIARDNSGQETRQSLSWQLDRQAPQIILDAPLLELPAQNRVSEQPYPITGTVRENNLASFQLNGQDVALQPGAQAGEFRFASQVGLPLGQPVSLTLEARDQAGNRLRREYSLELSGQAAINWVLPTEGSELLNLGEPIDLQVAARIEDLSGQLVPRVFLLSSTGDNLAEAGLLGDTTLKSATLQIPPQSGQYRLLAVLQDGNQQVVAQSSRSIAVVTQEQVPIAIERISPSNAARNVDPNDFITLYFNQAIDPAKVELKVFESANGKTYMDMDPLGVDPLEAKGYQLVDVSRSYEPVPGELSLLPGNQVVAFYPARDVAYAAEVSVEVRYDGQELQRIRYQTRALPTLISGAVFDQLQQPVPDLEVRLVELGRSTRTNRDGAFNFGFGDAAQENIAGGNYRLELNPGQANRNYGSERKAVAIQGGRSNDLGRFQLAQLNGNLPYSVLQGGQTFSLLQGELKLDLTQASLQFPDGTQSGDVHAQLLEFSQLPYPVEPLAMPYWMYGLQPGGIAVEGEVGVDLAALKLGDSYDYLPDNDDYVVLVGLDPQARRIVPVGVGQVSNYRVHSRGALALQTLDLIGFALVGGEAQPTLKAYAEGQLNLRQLHSELNRLNNSQ